MMSEPCFAAARASQRGWFSHRPAARSATRPPRAITVARRLTLIYAGTGWPVWVLGRMFWFRRNRLSGS
jgi:hypothetical protein